MAERSAITVTVTAEDVALSQMAPGTPGNIISYDAAGEPVAVATGTSEQVLTSRGAGLPPTFQTLEVTLAQMATGTTGNIISYDGAGAATAVATGTATHVLTSNGAGQLPSFQAVVGGSPYATTTGTSTAFVLTPTPAATAYTAGNTYLVAFHTACTADATINVSGLGAKSLKRYTSKGTKVAARFPAHTANIIYDGTDFVLLDQLPVPAGFNLMVDINPAHLYRATNVVESGGLVDTITDIGRLADKNFTQTGAARCPVATDGDGNVYLAPDGAADYYDAAAGGFDYLHNGAAFSLGFVVDMNGSTNGSNFLLDNSQNAPANKGSMLQVAGTATLYGPAMNTYNGGASNAQAVFRRAPSTGKYVIVINCYGHEVAGGATAAQTIKLYVGGVNVHSAVYTATSNTGAATYASRMFAAANVAANYFNGRLYELWINDDVIPERKVLQYSEWAANYYNALG